MLCERERERRESVCVSVYDGMNWFLLLLSPAAIESIYIHVPCFCVLVWLKHVGSVYHIEIHSHLAIYLATHSHLRTGTNGARHEIPIENLNKWQEKYEQSARSLNDKAFLHLCLHCWGCWCSARVGETEREWKKTEKKMKQKNSALCICIGMYHTTT